MRPACSVSSRSCVSKRQKEKNEKTEKRVIDTKPPKQKTINKRAENPMSVVEQSRRMDKLKKQNCPTGRDVYVASRKQKITKEGREKVQIAQVAQIPARLLKRVSHVFVSCEVVCRILLPAQDDRKVGEESS